MPGRIAALDVGTARIGVAVSDDACRLSFPHSTVHVSRGTDAVQEVGELLSSLGIVRVVVGWPLELDGQEGAAVKRTKQFISQLKSRYPGLKFVPQDERLTSVAAENALVEMATQGSEKKNHVDAIAAHFILEAYLARRKS